MGVVWYFAHWRSANDDVYAIALLRTTSKSTCHQQIAIYQMLTMTKKRQMKKCKAIFWCVKITKIGLRGRRGFVPRPKPAQNVNAVRLTFQSLSVTSPVTAASWAQNPVLCEEVVSLSHDMFSLTVSISGTLKLH